MWVKPARYYIAAATVHESSIVYILTAAVWSKVVVVIVDSLFDVPPIVCGCCVRSLFCLFIT